MKREIKFRGKRKTDGEWLYGYYFVNRGLHFIVTDGLAPAGNTFKDYEVDPETVGQYTGMKDCKGEEIFEGDIIEIPETDFNARIVGTVNYEDDCFCITAPNGHWDLCWNLWKLIATVIGKIHDNPELLEL